MRHAPPLTLASAALLAAACSGEGTPAAEPELTRVILTEGTIPIRNMTIAFHDASGAVLSDRISGRTGRSAFALKGSGMVTIASASVESSWIETVMGVEEGSTLHFALTSGFGDLVFETIRLPGFLPEIPFYELHTGCEILEIDDPGSEEGITTILTSDCIDREGLHYLIAFASNERERAAFSLSNGVATKFDEVRTVGLGGWRTDFEKFHVQIENAPADGHDIFVDHALLEGEALYGSNVQLVRAGTDGRARASFLQPPEFGDGVSVRATTNLAEGTLDFRASWIETRERGLTSTVTLDLAAGFLPGISDVELDVSNIDRPKISWKTTGPTDGADALYIELFTLEPFVTWTILAPPDTPSPLTLPELPTSLAIAKPNAQTFHAEPLVLLIDLSAAPSYASFVEGWIGPTDVFLDPRVRISAY